MASTGLHQKTDMLRKPPKWAVLGGYALAETAEGKPVHVAEAGEAGPGCTRCCARPRRALASPRRLRPGSAHHR